MAATGSLTPFERTAYRWSQNLRLSWFGAQYALSRRLSAPISLPDHLKVAMPSTHQLTADRTRLIERDLQNIEAGYYRLPHDLIDSPAAALRQSLAYFADLPSVNRRRRGEETLDLATSSSEHYPDYYRRAFHHQTDGYLSEKSARLYDYQVEILFGGAADAMRRQALVPVHEFLRERRIADCRLIDIACGTGRFLTFVKDNYPRLPVTALDVSPYYLAEARRNLKPWSRVDYVEAAVEAAALPEAAYDIAICIYLFHELPVALHAKVASALARMLKPAGLFVFLDSLQLGDLPDYDALLESFPLAFHEPYYSDYLRQDLSALFEGAGLGVESVDLAYLSRVMVLRKKKMRRPSGRQTSTPPESTGRDLQRPESRKGWRRECRR
jgi:ubiquinone/menaquinone biosynthesis C-methylase UbiE